MIEWSVQRSMYYPNVDVANLEHHAIANGVYVQVAREKAVKICELETEIGACEQKTSRWIHVESTTGGTFHSRPISQRVFELRLKDRRECCDERK